MRTTQRFGFCGLLACMGSFCLSTLTALPQDSKPGQPTNSATGEESPSSQTNAPSLRQLKEQNLAVLRALEQLREDRETTLNRYTETITGQLNVLRDALSLQRQQEAQAARNSNRLILMIAATVAANALLLMCRGA